MTGANRVYFEVVGTNRGVCSELMDRNNQPVQEPWVVVPIVAAAPPMLAMPAFSQIGVRADYERFRQGRPQRKFAGIFDLVKKPRTYVVDDVAPAS